MDLQNMIIDLFICVQATRILLPEAKKRRESLYLILNLNHLVFWKSSSL